MEKISKNRLSLELRLIILFLFFLITIMLSILLILVSTGVFNFGMKQHTTLFEKELTHISQNIYDDFADLSLNSVYLSEQLSKSIEDYLLDNGIMPWELSKHPDIINNILEQEFDKLLGGLQKSKSSGTFLILNATINPNIDGAENSRAGLLLKNMEAAVNSIYYDIRYMCGPSFIGRSNNIPFLPQWKMEFDVKEADYYHIPIQRATNSGLPLSRLYYWCPKVAFDNSDSVMLCSTPLIASNGTVMGVAGFEVRSMLFKLKYAPENSSQNRIFCMLAPSDDKYLYMEKAMFAGNYSLSDIIPSTNMEVLSNQGKLNQYNCISNSYLGLDKKVQLYATNSPFEKEEWRVVLLIPKEDMDKNISGHNKSIILFLVLLTLIFIFISILISRKFLHPVKKAFDTIKMKRISEHTKTNIPEIDDLMKYLAEQDLKTENDTVDSAAHNTAMFESFVENIKTLSMAEKAVFDLYMEEHTAKEIAEILCLSINTIKTHNRRIYMKLNVSSRKELLVYIQMMKELGGT